MNNERINNRNELKELRMHLRNNATNEERILWGFLKGSQIGVKFRRQHSIGSYILDFYCPSNRLAIELDGAHHFTKEGRDYDFVRDKYLIELNIKVIRFPNSLVINNLEAVLNIIKSEI